MCSSECRAAIVAIVISSVLFPATAGAVREGDAHELDRPRIPAWPCRLIVKPTLLGVIERGWQRSETLRRQCETLAAARAVVVLEWGRVTSDWHARTQIGHQGGVVVARMAIPPVDDAIRLVSHELQHVIEQVGGVDYNAEAQRPGSGVWQAVGGFETQGAIDAGARVWEEVRQDVSARRP
jgi:hypothetical protein